MFHRNSVEYSPMTSMLFSVPPLSVIYCIPRPLSCLKGTGLPPPYCSQSFMTPLPPFILSIASESGFLLYLFNLKTSDPGPLELAIGSHKLTDTKRRQQFVISETCNTTEVL